MHLFASWLLSAVNDVLLKDVFMSSSLKPVNITLCGKRYNYIKNLEKGGLDYPSESCMLSDVSLQDTQKKYTQQKVIGRQRNRLQ